MKEDNVVYQECLYESIEGVKPDFKVCGIKCDECKYCFVVYESELTSHKENIA